MDRQRRRAVGDELQGIDNHEPCGLL